MVESYDHNIKEIELTNRLLTRQLQALDPESGTSFAGLPSDKQDMLVDESIERSNAVLAQGGSVESALAVADMALKAFDYPIAGDFRG